jgi:hypothetical protein
VGFAQLALLKLCVHRLCVHMRCVRLVLLAQALVAALGLVPIIKYQRFASQGP